MIPHLVFTARLLPWLALVATDFTELICWQLANELNIWIAGVAARPPVQKDRKFCEQLSDAGSSAPRNIAEGFGRYDHPEFATFVKIALGSEQETRNNIFEAYAKRYITLDERDAGLRLCRRAIGAAARFRLYLRSTPTPPPKPFQPHDSTDAPPDPAPAPPHGEGTNTSASTHSSASADPSPSTDPSASTDPDATSGTNT